MNAHILVGLCSLLGLVLASPALACPREGDALVLARLAIHEATWRGEGEVGPIHETIAGIAERRGTSWRLAACAHSPRLTAGTVRRRWVTELDESGTRPAHWPRGSSWERWRPVWLAVLSRARLAVAGQLAPQCERPPTTWGSDEDIRRAARSGRIVIVVPCGSTANRFIEWGRR